MGSSLVAVNNLHGFKVMKKLIKCENLKTLKINTAEIFEDVKKGVSQAFITMWHRPMMSNFLITISVL